MHRHIFQTNALRSIIILLLGFSIGIIQQVNSSVIPSSNTTSTNSSLSATASFSGSLSYSSPTFRRPYGSSSYYYQIIKATVFTSGTYTFTSSGASVNLFGCLYDTYFNPLIPDDSTLIDYKDGTSTGGQFSISHYLISGNTYLLVVTTSSSYTTANYLITSSGSGSTYASMSSYVPTTTSQYGYISSSNPTFARPGSYGSSHYYYNSYSVYIYKSGTYTFQSSNSYSTDVYGCLYEGSFYASNPSLNKIACDDDGAGSLQFLITQNLDSSRRYSFVVTTSSSYVTGSYSLMVQGPSSVSLFSTTPYVFYTPIPVIIGIAVGSMFAFSGIIILVTVLCRRRRQQTIVRQTLVAPQYNRNVSSPIYPNVHQMPYGNPPSYKQ